MTLGAGDLVLCSGTLGRGSDRFANASTPRSPAGSRGSRCGAAITRTRAACRARRTPTCGRCSPITVSRSRRSISRGGGSRAPRTCTSPRSSTPRSSSRTAKPSCSASRKRSARGRQRDRRVRRRRGRIDDAAAAFAGLCDRAAEHGLLVHIEFLPWSRIPTSRPRGRSCVARTGRTGECSSTRGTTSAAAPTSARCARSPAIACSGIQLDDGPLAPEADLPTAALHERLLPGAGELDLGGARSVSCARSARSRRSASRCSPTTCTRSSRPRSAGGQVPPPAALLERY